MEEYEYEDSFKVRYVPEVRFSYQVDGEMYEGKRIAFGSDPTFPSRNKAVNFLEAYPLESVVNVFYNPEKPNEAVLSQKMRSMTAALIVGIVMLVLMVCFLCPLIFTAVNTFIPR